MKSVSKTATIRKVLGQTLENELNIDYSYKAFENRQEVESSDEKWPSQEEIDKLVLESINNARELSARSKAVNAHPIVAAMNETVRDTQEYKDAQFIATAKKAGFSQEQIDKMLAAR